MTIDHAQAFEIKYLGATTYKGSRVKIKDMRFNRSKTLNYNYSVGNVITQAQEYLVSQGYKVINYTANYNDTYYVTAAAQNHTFKAIS